MHGLKLPINLGRGWYLRLDNHEIRTEKRCLQLVTQDMLCEPKKTFGYNPPEEVINRACFLATIAFSGYTMQKHEDRKRQLFREHFLSRHQALATYLDWHGRRE